MELVARAEREPRFAAACLAEVIAGEPDTEMASMRHEVGARLIAKGLAELTILRKAWTSG